MLKQASENAFGHHFDARVRSDLGIVANAISDGSAHGSCQDAAI